VNFANGTHRSVPFINGEVMVSNKAGSSENESFLFPW